MKIPGLTEVGSDFEALTVTTGHRPWSEPFIHTAAVSYVPEVSLKP